MSESIFSFFPNLVMYLIQTLSLSQTQAAIAMGIGILACAIIAYLIGSINTGIIVSKYIFHDDVRKYGSGNAGATNMLRTYGTKYAVITLVGDMLKAAVAVILGAFIFQIDGAAIAGFFCMFGHMFPVFYRFRGGKGVACSAMIVLLMDPITFVILFVIYMAIIFMTRYVSLASVMCMLLYPMILHAFRPDEGIMFLCALLMCIFVVFMHRENIQRLYNRTESKLTFPQRKKKAKGDKETTDEQRTEQEGNHHDNI